MKTTEIILPPDVNPDVTERAIEEVIAESGLNVTLRDTLKSFPGCVHWHLKRGREAGILELTLWPEKRHAWFSVHRGRTALWIEEEMSRFNEGLQRHLAELS